MKASVSEADSLASDERDDSRGLRSRQSFNRPLAFKVCVKHTSSKKTVEQQGERKTERGTQKDKERERGREGRKQGGRCH